MKILLTATVQSHICQFHRPLADMLHENGCEVHVAARNNLVEKNGLKLDFADKVYNIPFSRSPKSSNNLKAYEMLKEILRTEHYDVVHCNTPMGGIVTRLAARKTRKTGTKVFYTAHGFHFYNGAPLKNWLIFYPVEKLFASMTDKLITINHEDYELAKRKFRTDVSYIHGVGVDGKRYHPSSEKDKSELRKELGFTPSQKIMLCVGELLPNKNQAMAVKMMKEVVKKYPDAVLLLAGNGPEHDDLQVLIDAERLQNSVRLLGYCTRLEKYQRIADVLVACSKREGLPLNIVEAMLSGNPVVATKNRGHCELVRDGETGFLVDMGDEKKMSEYVVKILGDKNLGQYMGEKARKFAEKYERENVRLELEKVYTLMKR